MAGANWFRCSKFGQNHQREGHRAVIHPSTAKQRRRSKCVEGGEVPIVISIASSCDVASETSWSEWMNKLQEHTSLFRVSVPAPRQTCLGNKESEMSETASVRRAGRAVGRASADRSFLAGVGRSLTLFLVNTLASVHSGCFKRKSDEHLQAPSPLTNGFIKQ